MSNDWMDYTGTVAGRTNTVIDGLLDWADKRDVNTIKRRNIEDATKHLTPVGSDDTIQRYVERVTEHGPFKPRGPGRWQIQWDRVAEIQEEPSSGVENE